MENKYKKLLSMPVTMVLVMNFPFNQIFARTTILNYQQDIVENDWVNIQEKNQTEIVNQASQAAFIVYNRNREDGKDLSIEEKILKTEIEQDFIDGSVRYSTADQLITVSFRGTEYLSDWFTNLSCFQENLTELGLKGAAHSGFLNRYLKMRAQVKSALDDLATKNNLDLSTVKILFTGHSMGGAMATLAAADLKNNHLKDNKDVSLNTWGSPRVFDHEGAKNFEKMEILANRFWRVGDVVPAAALGLLGYKHVGVSNKLGILSYFDPLRNHSMRRMKEQFMSSEELKIDRDHKGIMTRLKEAASITQILRNQAIKIFGIIKKYSGYGETTCQTVESYLALGKKELNNMSTFLPRTLIAPEQDFLKTKKIMMHPIVAAEITKELNPMQPIQNVNMTKFVAHPTIAASTNEEPHALQKTQSIIMKKLMVKEVTQTQKPVSFMTGFSSVLRGVLGMRSI